MEKDIFRTNEGQELFRAILSLKSAEECESFFRDICTIKEVEEMSARLKIAKMLSVAKPKSYAQIAKEVKTSTATVTRVAHWLRHGAGGYRLALKRITR